MGCPPVRQASIFSEQYAAGVHWSRAPIRMSVGITRRPTTGLHKGLNATTARNPKLLGRTNSSNELASATNRLTQPPWEKPTAATRSGSTKVWAVKKSEAAQACDLHTAHM